MNDDQFNRLIAAARQDRPDTSRAESGFETRLLARLRQDREESLPWFAWAWRLAPVFAAVVLLLGIWNFVDFQADSTNLRAAIAGGQESQLVAAHFGGE